MKNISRGDILLVELDPSVGTEIRKTRPAIVISNNINNQNSSLITVVPLTSKKLDKVYPFEILLTRADGLPKPSKALADQIRSLDKKRVRKILGRLSSDQMQSLEKAVKLHLAIW
jgi:mRNA interferase MazF